MLTLHDESHFTGRKEKGSVAVMCIKETNYGQRQYITARHAAKSYFHTHISALSCIAHSRASAEYLNSQICKGVPESVPAVTYGVLNVYLSQCMVSYVLNYNKR